MLRVLATGSGLLVLVAATIPTAPPMLLFRLTLDTCVLALYGRPKKSWTDLSPICPLHFATVYGKIMTIYVRAITMRSRIYSFQLKISCNEPLSHTSQIILFTLLDNIDPFQI